MMAKWKTTTAIAVITLIFMLFPFVVVIGASFDNGSMFSMQFPPRTLSLDNYFSIGEKHLKSLEVSLVVAIVVSVVAPALGLMASLGLIRGRLPGTRFLDAFFRLPVQIPLIVTGAVFLQFYYDVAAMTGINLFSSYAGLILAHLFITVPYAIGAISSVLTRFDRSLEEAAESLGATRWRTFSQVTFPVIRPGIVTAAFYAFAVSFGNVPISLFVGTGEYVTLPVVLFYDMQMDFQPGMLALSALIVIVSVVVVIGLQKFAGLDLVSATRKK